MIFSRVQLLSLLPIGIFCDVNTPARAESFHLLETVENIEDIRIV